MDILKNKKADREFVRKIEGKGLSTEDYTTEEKNKLAGLSEHDKGFFANEAAIVAAIPAGQAGWFVRNGETDTVWVWDVEGSAWVDTGVLDVKQALENEVSQSNTLRLNIQTGAGLVVDQDEDIISLSHPSGAGLNIEVSNGLMSVTDSSRRGIVMDSPNSIVAFVADGGAKMEFSEGSANLSLVTSNNSGLKITQFGGGLSLKNSVGAGLVVDQAANTVELTDQSGGGLKTRLNEQRVSLYSIGASYSFDVLNTDDNPFQFSINSATPVLRKNVGFADSQGFIDSYTDTPIQIGVGKYIDDHSYFIPYSGFLYFNAIIKAQDESGNVAVFKLEGAAKRDSTNNPVIVSQTVTTVAADAAASTWTATASVYKDTEDVSNQQLRFLVTGAVDTHIWWEISAKVI